MFVDQFVTLSQFFVSCSRRVFWHFGEMYCLSLHGDNLDHMDPGVVGKKGLLQLYGKVGINLVNEGDGRGSSSRQCACGQM